MRKTVKKIPYISISIIVLLGCYTRVLWRGIFLWLGVILYVATGAIYVVGALRKNTTFYHTYIGWAWMIPTFVFADIFITDIYASWSMWYLFLFSAWIATFLVWLWRKDESIEHWEYSTILNAIVIIWLACAIAAMPNMINSSQVLDVAFKQVQVVDKEIDENCHAWSGTEYNLIIEPEDSLIHSKGFAISKQYYDSINIGDKIPVCTYTGILGKQFYSFFEDQKKDYYGYNQWTREEYRKYRSE